MSLVLNRTIGQRVIIEIGDDIVSVRVCDVSHRSGVKLGIDAPLSVKILRSELSKLKGGGPGSASTAGLNKRDINSAAALHSSEKQA
jgi:carbon storage regulator CsrA